MPEESTTADLEQAVRLAFDVINRRDFDAVVAGFAPDAVWDVPSMGLGLFEGREAIRGLLEDWPRPYEDFAIELEEVRQLGIGAVFFVQRHRGRPARSSGFAAQRIGSVITWADGLVERFATFTDIDQARAAGERLARARG
jgi:ketosteroid isomerase-like protein